MNGIVVVDKPQGFTSFDVVAKMRGICGTKKIGHGGTLDPMATGVLPVFVGQAAKAVDLAPCQDKAYRAVVLFGLATDTGDVTGQVLARSGAVVSEGQLREVLPRFTGELLQLPPMYSAVKVGGKPLYRYAREGVPVRRTPRAVTVHALHLCEQQGENRFVLQVRCSKGTYVRTLCEDIGKALGAPAVLAALRRTQSGAFALGQAHTLGEIQQAKEEGTLWQLVRPVEELFMQYPAVRMDAQAAARLQNGAPVYGVAEKPGLCRLVLHGDEPAFLGLGRLAEDGCLRAEKLFCPRQSD